MNTHLQSTVLYQQWERVLYRIRIASSGHRLSRFIFFVRWRTQVSAKEMKCSWCLMKSQRENIFVFHWLLMLTICNLHSPWQISRLPAWTRKINNRSVKLWYTRLILKTNWKDMGTTKCCWTEPKKPAGMITLQHLVALFWFRGLVSRGMLHSVRWMHAVVCKVHGYCFWKTSHNWLMMNTKLSPHRFGPAMKTGSSRRFKW